MGIKGLLTLIKSEKSYEMIDLVKEARKNGIIEILVDFHAIFRFITQTFLEKIANDYDNKYLYFPIGVYDKYIEAIYDLHKGFEDVGIRLVWIIDGPKGVDEIASDQKASTWKRRDKENKDKMEVVLSACRDKTALKDLNNVIPLIFFDTALSSLKNAGAEVINLLEGESDDYIAYEFHKRKSYGILTNDTDFVIFPDCIIIFEQLLNQNYEEDNMKLPFMDYGTPGKVFKKPDSFFCPVIKQSHIFSLFEFTNYGQLIVLSILKGNDFTGTFADKLTLHLGIRNPFSKTAHVRRIANYILSNAISNENLKGIPGIITFMADNPQLLESIKYCSSFYSLERIKKRMNSNIISNPEFRNDPLTVYLAKMLAEGKISKMVYGIHFGVNYDTICPEKLNDDCPAILSLLFGIRKRIYPYLLDKKLNYVMEWRSQNTDNPLVKIFVKHSTCKTHIIKAKPNNEREDSEQYGIDLFEEVITHLEINAPLNYIDKYGIEKAFVCYILRYIYTLTKEKTLNISENEFKCLFVTVFYQFSLSKEVKFKSKLNQDSFLRMKICPSERCLIIGTWFMNIYFIAKYLCGGAFNLTEEFPSPAQVINGAVYYTFYENIMCGVNKRIYHLDKDLILSITSLADEIITTCEEEYKTITK